MSANRAKSPEGECPLPHQHPPYGPFERVDILPNSLHDLGKANAEGMVHPHHLYSPANSQPAPAPNDQPRRNTDTNASVNPLSGVKLQEGQSRPVRAQRGGGGAPTGLELFHATARSFMTRHWKWIKLGLIAALVMGYHVYLAIALVRNFSNASSLLVLTLVVWALVAYYKLVIPMYATRIEELWTRSPAPAVLGRLAGKPIAKISAGVVIGLLIAAYLVWDTSGTRHRLVGLVGMGFYIAFMFLFSRAPSKINWRPVLFGFLFQFLFGLAILRWEYGSRKFNDVAEAVMIFLDFSKNGTDFVYGFLSAPPTICGMDPVFAFSSIQVLVYFGAVVSLLYYYGVMQVVLKKMAWAMQRTLGTTATESLNACACVFLGMSESPLLIRPYLDKMTSSELHAVMTSGFSCIAGSLFATYISFGACPRYLLSSTVMSAPGSLACSKLLYPEVEESQTARIEDLELPQGEESNALESISNGAVAAVELVFAVVANLIAFLALLALLDSVILYLGRLVGQDGWSFELGLGYLFFPLAYIMGANASWPETLRVAQLMGTKTALNEFIAYRQLGKMVDAGELSPRSAMIATYALCGFSNFGSIGIALGTLGGMAPRRKPLLAKLALRALLAGSISCFLTASLAGVLIDQPVACNSRSSALAAASGGCFNITQFQRTLATPMFASLIAGGTQGAKTEL